MAEIQHWSGFSELEDNLKLLGEQMRERGTKYMMSRAAVPMRDEARRRAPVLAAPDSRRRAGTIQRAIQIWRHRKSPYAATYYVGVRGLSKKAVRMFKQLVSKKSSNNPNDPYYWRFVELGTSKMAARPFLRASFEAKKSESVKAALEAGRDFVRRTQARFKRSGR